MVEKASDARYDYEIPTEEETPRQNVVKASDAKYDYEIPTEEETPRQNVVKASDAKYDYELPADAAAGDEAPKSEYLGKPPGYEPKTTAAPYPAGFPIFGGADPNDARPIKRADQIRAERAASAGQAAPAPPSAWQVAKAAALSPFGVPPEEQAPGLRAAMQATPWTSGAATAADIVEKGAPAAAESFTASQFPLTGKVVAPLAGKVARGLATAATNPVGAAAAALAMTPAAPVVGGVIAVKSGWDAASRDFPDLVEGVMTGDLEKVTDAGANLVQDALGVGGGGFLARGARGPARAAAATEATARPAPGGGTPARPGGPGLAAELRQLAPQDYTVAKGALDDAVAATAAKHVESAAAEGHLTRADLDAAAGARPSEVAALERGADAAEARSGGAPAAEAGGEGGLARQGEKLVQTLTEEKPPSGNPILDSILKELENANAETVTPAAAPAAEGAGLPATTLSGGDWQATASGSAGTGAAPAAPEAAEVGAGGPPVGPGQEKVQGEAPLDMRAQEQALLAGARQAILFHKAGPGPDSAFPPFGIERVMTPAGEIWFRTDTGLTMDRVKEMAQSVEGLGKLLEMPAGRPKGENPKAVSVIDQDGNEVWSAEIDDKTRQATLKRATAMAEKIGGVVTETTRKQVVAGRQQRAKEQTNVPLPPKPEELQGIRPYEQGETVLYTSLGGKEKEGVIGSVLDNGKFRVVDRQGMASIVGPEKMRRPEAAKPQTEAAPAPPIVGKRPFETPTDIRRFNDALRSHVPEGQRMDEGVGTTSDNKLVFKLDDGNLYKVTLSKNEFGRTQAELERVPEGDVVGYSEGQSPSEQMRSQAINAPPAPAKKPKKAKAAPAVDMNRQAVANHLKVTVGSGWEEELVGLDRAAQDFEAKEGRSKAEFWKELANDTIGAAPAPAPIHKPVEAPKVETGDLGKVVTGPDDVAITAEGEEIPYTWAFVNVHKLIPSHDSAGNPNPGYARAGETIQNRDRASEDSVAQMSSIKSNPDPRRLAYAPSATDGAPIIRPDGRALTNGRTAGLQAAFKEGNAAKYRAGIAAEARRTGMSEEAIAEGMKDPESVLVRLAKAEYINKTDQTRLARDTNVGVGLRMSITEQGRSDAAVMMSPGSVDETTRVLALIPEDGNGDIRSSAYLPFAQAFAKAFVPANERAGLFDKGSLTNEGALRVQAALVAAAYGDSKVVDRFLTSDAGAGNPLRKAVIAVAPDFAAVNMQQQHGELEAFDVTPPLVDAAEFIVDMQASGKTLEQTLRPTGKTGSGKKLQAPELIKATDRLSPEGLDIINILDQYARTPAKASKLLIGIFRELAKVAQQLKISRDQGGLFGEGGIEKVPVPKISEAWKIAKENYEEQQRGKGLLEDEDAEPVGAEAEGAGTATLEGAGEGGTAPDKGKTPPPDDQLREADAEYGAPAIAAPTFFSAVERAIDAMPFRSMPAADLAARLTKAPGVKQEELEWVGLVQWLAEVSGRDMTGRVSKDEVKAFLEENRVEVQPITLGVDPRERAAEIAHKNEMDAAENDWRGALANLAHGLRQRGVIDDTFPLESNAPELRPGGYLADKARAAGLGDLLDSYHKTLEHWKAVQEHAPLPSDRKPAKFDRYTLPGGENYREVLLTKIDPATAKLQAREAELSRRLDEIAALPAAEHEAQGEALTQKYDEVLWELRRVQNRLKGMSEKAADLLYQRDKVHRELERIDPAQVPWDRLVARGGETDPYKLRKNDPEYQRLTAEFERLDAELGEENKRTKKYQKEPFSSGHFDTPNVLVHYRAKDRTDAQGKKVYFLEEVQSDWHQLGRTQGYADPGDSGADAGVPDAPFKKTWPLLAFKHALRYAAENGYDSIAWTPGEVQAARYDLSKRINELVWNKTEKVLIAIDTNGNTVLAQNDVTAEKLPDYIGKEATARILQQPNDQSVLKVKGAEHHEIKRLTGANLSIGGEGMKGFYDKILPAEIGKYVKAWGGKVSLGQPERTGESLSNGRRVDEYAGLPLDPVYSGMGAAVENNKILRAVVGEFPVYVMDLLAANGIAPEDLVRDPSVLSDRLPLHAKRSVRLGLAGALSKIGADLRAGLDAAYETRLDSEILPAVKASDIDTDVATGILFPEPLHVGGGDSTASLNVGARGAGAGTEAGRLAVTSRGGEKSAAEIAAFEEWHKGIVAQRRGDVESDKWWQIHITPAMREAALAGQPLFEKPTKYDPRQKGLFDDGDTGSLRKPAGEEGTRAADGRADEGVLPAASAEGADRDGLGLSRKSSRFTLGQLAARNREAQERGTATVEKLLADLRASVPGGVDPDNDPLVVTASKIAKTFRRGEFVSLVGYDVPDAKALGVVAQIAANPAYETLRIALLDDDNVLVQEIPVSCHLPAGVMTNHIDMTPDMVAAEMKRYGATKWALIHNHPGGDATPSGGDRRVTVAWADRVPGFIGHVVIDHNTYSIIKADGSYSVQQLDEKAKALRPKLWEDPDESEAAKHLGIICNGSEDLAKLGISMHTQERSVLLVFANRIGDDLGGRNRIRALATVPYEKAIDYAWMTRRIRYEQGFHGAQNVMAYSSGKGLTVPEAIELASTMQDLYLVDAEGGVTLSDFLLGSDPRLSYFNQFPRGHGDPGPSQGFMGPVKPVRLAEAPAYYGENDPYEADGRSPREQAFDRWFEGSKVVNEDGSPKVVYHGTHSEHDFDAFWTQGYKVDLGAHFGTPGQANDIIGTRDLIKPGAPTYMPGTTKAMQAVRASSLKRIYPVYLSIKNPLRLPDLGGWVRPRSYIVTIPPGAKGVEGELRKLAVETEEKFEAGDVGVIEDFPGQVKQLLEDMGYDGIVYVNENEAFDEEADSYIAFHPWQIKSATGNKGTFDPANKSILHEGDTDYGVPPMREKGIPADAPHVALARNTQALQGDPDYKEAKAGDREAAVRLVNRLVTPEAVARAKAFGKDVTYVFPHAEEAAGRNAIPGLVATKLAVETGGGLDEEIIQANRVHHTGANAKQRFVARPTFEGPVQKGARYVIVDDVTTFGNTLAELANHIQKNGGEVAGTFVLADASRTPTLAPERRRVDALETRLGDALRATLGLDPAALTRPEVDYFLGFKSPESLRTTVATARQERADRLRSKSVLPPDEVAEEGSSYGSPDREKNLQKWAGKTVVRNKDGSLKRVYHGTVSEFDIFSQKKASVESDLGAGFYFTSNPDDASVNYGSDKGADLENKVEHLAERIQGEMLDAGEEGDTEALMNLARDKAREQLGVQHGGAVLPVYLRIEKPLVLGGPGEPYWGYEYDEENDSDKGELTDLFEAMRVVRNGIEADGGDVGRDEYDRNLQKLYDYAGNKASKLLAIVKDAFVYAGDENGNLISGEAVRRVVEKMGYDGIVDHTVDIKFGTRSPASKYGKAMHGVTGDTVHYIVFSPNQIKSATGNRGTFSRRSASLIKEEDSSYGKKKSALDYASRFAPGAARALKPRGPEDEIRLAATDPAAGVFSAIFASRAPKASKTSQLPSPLDSHDPKVEARLRAAEGIVAPSILARVKQSFVDLEHSFTRHFIELDTKESKTIAADTDILRQLEASPDYAKSVALDTLAYITDGLDKPAARLFTRILALRDLHRSIDEGLYEDKDELPFGYEDKAAVTYDLRKYEAMAKEDEAVAGALAKREKYASELTQKLVDMELLPEDVLEDDRYYHRQVMAVFNQKQAAYVGTGSRDVRVHTKGFQKARTGGGDFNMRYQEAEFEWMAQAHSQIAMQEALDRLREANDIKPALERNAKWQNTLAIYGGIENYQRVQALKAEKAEIYTSAGLVLESDEKKRIAAINAELEEIDPLKPFTDRMGWSIHDLGKRAEEGELDHAPDWLQEAVDELRASSEWEEFRGDSESELFFPLLNYLVSAGKGGSKEAAYILKAVADKKKFIKDELGKDFKTWRGLIPDAHPLAPKSRAVVWQPEKGSIFYRAQTLPERALERFLEEIRSDESEAVDKEAVEALLGKAREALVKAGPKQEWVIPEGLAHTLDNWKGGGREKGFESTWVTLQQGWKQWVLLNPVRALRYNLNNASGDVDVVIAAFPGALRGWAQAARDLWKYTVKEDKSDTALVEEIQRATKLGVVSSGQSFQEIPDINEAGAFKGLTSDDPNVVQKTLETYWSGTKKFSTWRENTLRLAVFRYLEKELKAGAKLYGASRRHEVDAIKDVGERAAKIARELVGDYGNISVSGQYIRRHLIPFYSWMEINAPRYVRLLQNAAYEDRGGRRGGGGGDDERGGRGGRGGAAGRVAGVAAKKIAVNYAKLALFAPLLYGAIQAWNHLVFPEEEKLLAGNRKTLHLILGRNSDGSIRSIRLQGALSDALEIFGAGNVVSDVMDIASGKSTWRNKLNDALTSPIDKIVGGWEPFSKTLFELGFGYKSYPSLFKEGTTDLSPKKIRDLAEYAGDVVWPVGALYRKVTGRPRRPSPDMGIPGAGPLLDTLLVARTDPGEAAYWYSRNLAGKFLEAQGKTPSTGGPTGEAKDRADALYYFKRACEWGDDDAAGKWLAEYYELGGTPQKMNEAFVREHPLGGLPLGQRGAFVSSLSEEDRAVVQSAVEWYEKGRERMWTIAPQVPYTATYRKMAP